MFKKECELYFTLRHPNIVQRWAGRSIDSAKLYMVMEFCANGTLGDVLEDENLSSSSDGRTSGWGSRSVYAGPWCTSTARRRR